jgi:hypothetical protein
MRKYLPFENELLMTPFTLVEIHIALFQMEPNKARSPDGFSILFYLTYWDLLKEDIFAMFQDFYKNDFDLSQLNRALICLIPKIQNASLIQNYRPISLLNCSYKIFSKVLTNRLYPVIDRLIRPNQLVFLK